MKRRIVFLSGFLSGAGCILLLFYVLRSGENRDSWIPVPASAISGTWIVSEINHENGKPVLQPIPGCSIDLMPNGVFVMHNWNQVKYTVHSESFFTTNHIVGTWTCSASRRTNSERLELKHQRGDNDVQQTFHLGALRQKVWSHFEFMRNYCLTKVDKE